MRHRKNLLEMAATHIRMMHKALEQMNVKVQHVITDITGKSGQDIIKSIVGGERNSNVLASLCDGRIKADKKSEIIKSLEGIWKEEHIFELEQSFTLYNIYQQKIRECDIQIEKHLQEKAGKNHTTATPKARSNKNNLNFNSDEILKEITGTDLPEIFGITSTNATEIISEIGLDMSKWPTAKHFTSWLNLAPNNRISGGKKLSGKKQKRKNMAGQIFKLAAFSIQRSKHWLAAFYHRIKARRGTASAVVATARKIAEIFYIMLKDKTPFKPIPAEKYSENFKVHQIRKLRRKAQAFGLQLVEV
jgi:transposase